MTSAVDRLCEWDSLPNPRFNLYTIGNSSEVVPGVIRPLTGALFQRIDADSGSLIATQLELTDIVPNFPPPTANWVGLIGGRAALSITWFATLMGAWQLGEGGGAWDQYLSATGGADVSAQRLSDEERARRMAARVKALRDSLPEIARRDREAVLALAAAEAGRDYSGKDAAALWAEIGRLRAQVTEAAANHLHVSMGAGDYTDLLNKFLDRAVPGHDPALVIALTSALGGVESAGPATSIGDVAAFIAERPALAAGVRALSPHQIAERLARPADDDWRAFAQRFAEFIAEYGFRGQAEFDPGVADWAEEPAFALSAIKAQLDMPAEKHPRLLQQQAAAQREAIEARVLAGMAPEHQEEYRALLAGAQTLTRLREYTKATWIRHHRIWRRPLLALSERLVEAGVLAERDDLFWLREEEIEAAIRGELTGEQARAAIARRRAEAARLETLDLPEVFALPVTPMEKAVPQGGTTTLSGMPVSAGSASGPARVVLSTEAALEVELAPGEVLVAPFTDAPWTPLFIPAAAVVVETGGILSHAATVAREFGIPAVVGVKGATQLIRTGQRVTVDGMTGTITFGV